MKITIKTPFSTLDSNFLFFYYSFPAYGRILPFLPFLTFPSLRPPIQSLHLYSFTFSFTLQLSSLHFFIVPSILSSPLTHPQLFLFTPSFNPLMELSSLLHPLVIPPSLPPSIYPSSTLLPIRYS